MTNSSNTSNNSVIITEVLPSDILCGKDKTYGKHPGNQVYRRLIEERAVLYANTGMSKQVKMGVTKEIVAQLTTAGARFLRKVATTTGESSTDGWEEISNQQARDKTSHALRFCAKYHTQKKRPLLLPARPTTTQPSSTTSSTTSSDSSSNSASTVTNTKSATSKHPRHRRMVSSETLGSLGQHSNNAAIAIFQRQQAILHQSLNHHHRRQLHNKAIWAEEEDSSFIHNHHNIHDDDDDEDDEDCEVNDDEDMLEPPSPAHYQSARRHSYNRDNHHNNSHIGNSTCRHHNHCTPDGVVSSSRALLEILQEPLHESMNEDGDWDGYFIQPSTSSA